MGPRENGREDRKEDDTAPAGATERDANKQEGRKGGRSVTRGQSHKRGREYVAGQRCPQREPLGFAVLSLGFRMSTKLNWNLHTRQTRPLVPTLSSLGPRCFWWWWGGGAIPFPVTRRTLSLTRDHFPRRPREVGAGRGLPRFRARLPIQPRPDPGNLSYTADLQSAELT